MQIMELALYRLRLQIIQSIRSFFNSKDFLEVETPLLSELAIPESGIPLFHTRQNHPWIGEKKLQLLPSPEYFMKQLLSSGWPSIYQFSRSFRNGEQTGRIHSREFTMLEYYATASNYMDSLALTEQLLHSLIAIPDLPGKPESPRPRIVRMEELFDRAAGIDLAELCGNSGDRPSTADMQRIRRACAAHSIEFAHNDSWEVLFNRLFLNLAEPELARFREPVFLLDYPAKLATLSSPVPESPWTQRWELYWQGIELANCFTEERNATRIEQFFAFESKEMEGSAEFEQTIADPDFVEKTRNMPPASGTALGLDRLIMLLLGKSNIAEVIPFAQTDPNAPFG